MRGRMYILFLLMFITACAQVVTAPTPQPTHWFKGNTHTHTLWSDGDGAPEFVADWYKNHGYNFLVFSDHNVLQEGERWVKVGTGPQQAWPTSIDVLVKKYGTAAVKLREKDGVKEMRLKTLDELRKSFEEASKFILIKGEEITDAFQHLPIHHNSFNQIGLIKPMGGGSVREILERTVRAVEAEEKKYGRPVLVHLNHPNLQWAVSPYDLAHVLGERFFEVYNGHQAVQSYGDKDHMSTEQMWDYVLALRLGELGGNPLYALATDDAHQYHRMQVMANPGRGWIMVRAEALTPETLIRAMRAGDFYASSGVVLDNVLADKQSLTIQIAAQPGVTYTTKFIGTRPGGKYGEVLQETTGPTAHYQCVGDELYVRATVISSKPHPNGYAQGDLETAWVQPVVVRRSPGK